MSEWPDHYCPACGAKRKPVPRHPWHLCNGCRDSATDVHGRKLRFFNTHPSGGFGFEIADTGERFSCRAVIALVAHRPVYVTEARFGGTVAQPIPDSPLFRDTERVSDLTSKVNPPENLTPLGP